MRLLIMILSVLVMIFALMVMSMATAEAHDRRFLRCPAHSGDFCDPPAPLTEQAELQETGVWRWSYKQAAGAPSLLGPVQQGLEEWAAVTGIRLVRDQVDGNLNYAATSREFTYGNGLRVGCPGATACLNAYGRDVDIWYDAQLMSTYFPRSQVGVVLHELGHAQMDAGEQYIHTGGFISCNSDPTSVMSCGIGHALFIQPFDKETWALFHGLPKAGYTGTGVNGGGNYIFWCRPDPRATHMAIMAHNTVTKGYRWTGVIDAIELNPRTQCQGFLVDKYLRPNEIPCINVEHGANKRLGRNDTCRRLKAS